jgi:hypothetical protein
MRKVVQETKWRVSLTGAQGPIEKVVDAPSQDIAVSRAMRAFPGQQFSDVEAKLIDTQSNVPTAQASAQNALPQQMQGLRPIQQMATPSQILQIKQQQVAQESAIIIDARAINYPYSITLPSNFRSVLRETSPGPISFSNGQYRVVIETQEEMRSFLGKLQRCHNRNAVRVIAEGIRSSIP